MADILIARLAPLTTELRLIRTGIDRLADLLELDLQNRGITTRIIHASESDLKDTAVDYTDPALQQLVEMYEAGGKKMSDDQRKLVAELLASEATEE